MTSIITRPKAQRYDDPFLNALMFSHQMTSRGELWLNNAKVADISFVSGSVVSDRNSRTRRIFTGDFDPRKAPRNIGDLVTPFGTELRVLRGIRFPDNHIEEHPIFYGRIDVVEFSRTTCSIRASSRCAFITDARFEAPRQATTGMTVVNQMKALISEVMPLAPIDVTATSTLAITSAATWDRERDEALDNLAASIGAEWYAGPDGHFHIDPIPANNGEPADWIVDSGDTGVLINRVNLLDRAEIYNGMVVAGEPPDGTAPVYAVAHDTSPTSPLRWGGPYGNVPKFFTSQFITTQGQAQSVANDMLADAVSAHRGLEVTCVANPKLHGVDTLLISTGTMPGWDGLYFINGFTLPLDPESSMTLSCHTAMEFSMERGESVLRHRTVALRGGIRWP